MNVNERINKIKEYFVTFNVHEGIAYVLTKFPKKWSLFNKSDIEAHFNVKIEPRDEGIFFLCEIQDGFDVLFDAIDYIVSNNLSLEEKTSLLELKIKELSEIFMSEPLEKLKTLEFTFPKKSAAKTKKNVVKTDLIPLDNVVDEENKVEEAKITTTHVEFDGDATCLVPNNDIKESKPKKNKSKKNIEDSSLLDFAKNMIDEE